MVPSIKEQMKPPKFREQVLNKSKGILDNHAVRHNIDTREGKIHHIPTLPKHIVNKEYVDDKNVESFPTALTSGSIIFSNGSNLTQDNANLFWNVGRTQLESNLIKITSDGTQAAPALKFNDTNTGFFKVGDSVRLSLNNSTILIMNATGLDMNTHKIIGVVDPTANQEAATKKYVDDNDSDTTDHTALSNIGTNTHAQIDTHLADNSQAHSDYMLNTGDTASGNYNFDSGTFFIDSATNKVGIGTTTPQRMLHAHGVLIRASGAAIAGIEMNVGTSSTPNVDWDMFTLGDDLVFRERKGADNTRMTLKAGGFVGIGTTNPGQRLDIGNGTGTHVIRVNAAAAGTAAHIFSQAGTEVGRISFPASTTMTFSIGAGVATSMTISSAGGVSVLGDFKAGTIFSDATIENPKAKMTTLGGYAIKLTNRTGANSVAGHVVTSDSANNDAVVKVIQNVPNATGVFLDSGVANGAEAWVVVSGIADVFFVAAATRGFIARTFVTVDADYIIGQAKSETQPTSPFSVDKHFCEIGHCIETTGGAGLGRCVLHFN